MDYPAMAVLTRWMEGAALAVPQSASDSLVVFDFITPSSLGTIQYTGGWIDVRAHKHIVLIATPDTTDASIRVESKRTSKDPVVSVLAADTVCAAGSTTEVLNSDLSGVAFVRVMTTSGTSPNTVAVSFFIN